MSEPFDAGKAREKLLSGSYGQQERHRIAMQALDALTATRAALDRERAALAECTAERDVWEGFARTMRGLVVDLSRMAEALEQGWKETCGELAALQKTAARAATEEGDA